MDDEKELDENIDEIENVNQGSDIDTKVVDNDNFVIS